MGSSSSMQTENPQTNPNTEGIFTMAMKLKEQKNWQQAMKLMERLVSLKPSASIFAEMGELLQNTLAFSKAKEFYEKSLDSNPENPHILMKLANILAVQNKKQKAISYLEKALNINPEHLPSLNLLAITQVQKGLYEKATDNFQFAVRKCNENRLSFQGKGEISDLVQANLYNNLGNAYKYKNMYESAIDCYQKAINLNDQNSLFYVNCALCLAQPQIENYPKAYEYLCKAEKILSQEQQDANPYVLEEVRNFKQQIEQWNYKKHCNYTNAQDKKMLQSAMNSLEDNINSLFESNLQEQSYTYQFKVTGEQKQTKICNIWYEEKMKLDSLKKAGEHIYELYREEGNEIFAFIPLNFIIFAFQRIRGKKLKFIEIEHEAIEILDWLGKKFPASSDSSSTISSKIQSFEDKQNRPNMFQNIFFKTYENLLSEIIQLSERAASQFKDFDEFLKEICLQKGYHYKSGLKFPQGSEKNVQSKIMIRVIQKLIKEVKDKKIQILEKLDKSIEQMNSITIKDVVGNFFKIWKETIQEILANRMKEKIQTKCYIYDFLRAKCMYTSVDDIQFTAEKFIQRCKQKQRKIIQIDNRLNKNTKDLVFKVEFGGVVGQIQLCQQFDSFLNEFNHGIYEIKRSPVGGIFGSVLWLGKLKQLTIMTRIKQIKREVENVGSDNAELYSSKVSLEYVIEQYEKLRKTEN